MVTLWNKAKRKEQALSEIEKCPDCGSVMEKGYLYSDGVALIWSNKILRRFTKGEILERQLWHVLRLEAHRCTRCKAVLFHYDKVALPETPITPESFLKNCATCGVKIPLASEYCPKCGAKQKEGVKP